MNELSSPAALDDILDAFNNPENALRLNEAKEAAGNDMLRMMQIVFPLTTQIQMEVITKYGFTGDGDGIIRFAQTLKLLEKQDAQVAELNSQLRSTIMPQMAAPEAPLCAPEPS
ncbi:hypothetical protein CAPTEDRAFT_153318 [Capitella teleta]|uniref:Protein C10 n=1 Tax=Capitella teleta TaxID=283909 RepID=R7VLR2_CAPTE|nr:hypothetical protein CAPTEDRAFT_153318 [Capitella teleta]|eukprot:ELU17825.1 hypothetical protein CAPTEDRAFT_153318 [Capitella teleta]